VPSTDGGVSSKDDALGQKCVDKRADKSLLDLIQLNFHGK